MYSLKTAALLLASVPLITGHGGAMWYKIDGIWYNGAYGDARNETLGSIQREWNYDSINTLSDLALPCRRPGNPMTLSYHAPMKAGGTITIDFHQPSYSNTTFGHPYGAMTAYLGRCPDSGCEDADLNSPIWVKVWEAGLLEGEWTTGHWQMEDVMNGANLEVPVPASLRPGKYILKNDMINLQTGPVQIFPNCAHLEISGDGDSFPEESELLSFPGAYDQDVDLGIPGPTDGAEWFYVEHKHDTVYTIPGGPVWEG